jgi:hypothetical protein
MKTIIEITISLISTIFEHINMFLSSFSNEGLLSVTDSVFTVSVILAVTSHSAISESLRACIRRWRGGIDDKFSNINNIVTTVISHKSDWPMPSELFDQLINNYNQLDELISKCHSTSGSSADRMLRNTLLRSTANLCRLEVKIWAYSLYTSGIITANDVHLLGFLLPDEHGGHRTRTEATNVIAEVSVKIINEDFIRVVVNQSAGKNAARVSSGWPKGVRNILIVITSADEKMEIHRMMSTQLHNDVCMPKGSHGKQFIIKASFLKHIDDEPRFGNEQTFSMPLTTEDFAIRLEHQNDQDSEVQLQEIERLRKEIERLQAELNAQKK